MSSILNLKTKKFHFTRPNEQTRDSRIELVDEREPTNSCEVFLVSQDQRMSEKNIIQKILLLTSKMKGSLLYEQLHRYNSTASKLKENPTGNPGLKVSLFLSFLKKRAANTLLITLLSFAV